MGWVKDITYCRYCKVRHKWKHLYIWDDFPSSVKSNMYFCKKCGYKDEPDTYQRTCVGCDVISYQSTMKDICDQCSGLLCLDCIENNNYYQCFRCEIHKLCENCAETVEFNGKEYITCNDHNEVGLLRCYKYINRAGFHGLQQCKHITGPNRKYCKQHRYSHMRRRYIRRK